MSPPTIHQRLLDIESEFLRVLSADNHEAAVALSLKWAQLITDLRTASTGGFLDNDTVTLAHTTASQIAILSDFVISRESASAEIATELTRDFDDVEKSLANLDLNDSTSEDTLPSIPHGSRPESSLPPYIEPAYKWLLKHLHNPYPKKEVKEKIADETGSSIERISDWFVDVRRRMGWNALLREEFGRKRVDLIDAATRFYLHPNRKYPLSPDIHGKFVQMEAFAQDMYAAKLVPSALSNKLTAAVKDLTPERQEEARLQRLRKAQAKRDVAKLGVYPSPPASGASSPVSDPGASTSYSGRKRSRSEASSDDDEDSLSKRFRYVSHYASLLSLITFTEPMALSLSPPLPPPATPPPPAVSAAYPTQMLLPALNACAPTALPPTPSPSPFPSRGRPTSWPTGSPATSLATRTYSSPTSSWISSSSTRPSTTCPRRLPRRLNLRSKVSVQTNMCA
jgi:hypothetical protein